MRNLKKVLAVIVVVTMILSTMMVSVFADDTTATTATADKSASDICKDLGVLKGGSNGVDAQYLSTPTQRIQAAIIYLRMLGLEDEARAYQGTDNFTDASQVASISGATNILAYLKANPALGWVGDGKKFSPTEDVSPQQLYKVMLTVLGYEQGTDFDYSETLFFAKFVGMSKIAKIIQVTNGDLATALVEVLNSPAKGTTADQGTFINTLITAGIVKADVAAADGFNVPAALTITSVVAPDAMSVAYGATVDLPLTVAATMSDDSDYDAAVTWGAVDTTKVGAQVVHGTIKGFDAGVDITINVAPLALDVASVTVPNLRQMVITYNSAVSGDTVKDATKYTVTAGGTARTVADASLSADGKSVTLTLAATTPLTNYSTNNKVVISKDIGFSADKTIDNIVARDTAVPTIVSAETTGPRTINITFSEPIDRSAASVAQRVAAFTLDSGKIGLDGSTAAFNTTDTVLTINTLSDMQEGAHTIQVSGTNLKDSAAYPVAGNTISFNFAKDTSALTATVTSATEKSVKIKFNKAIKVGTFVNNANVLMTHTYNTALNQVTGAAVSTTDNQEFTIAFSKPLPPGTSTMWLNYPDNLADANKIQDGYGNVFAATTFQVTVTADTTAPTVSASFTDANHIQVTYSEDVQDTATYGATAAGDAAANYTLTNGTDSITVNSAAFDGTSRKVVNLTTGIINGGSLTLIVKNVKDVAVAQNKMADTTLTIAATDKVAPDLDGTTPFVQISATKVRVNFTEPIDVTTLTDKNNYTVSGSALGADDTVTAINSNKSAVITFNVAPLNNSAIVVGRVKDAAGNWTTWLSKAVGNTKNTLDTVAQSAAELIGGSKIKLTVDDQLATTGTVADYVYSTDGSTWFNVTGISSFTVDAANNKTYIELNIGYDAGNDTGLSTPVYIATTNGTTPGAASANIKNGLDQTLKIAATTTTTDKYAPKYLSVATGATSGGRLNTVVLTFSENLYVPSVSDSDFTVDGFDVASVAVAGTHVTITLKDKDNSDTAKPKVTLVGSVEDTSRNVLTGSVDQTCP